MTTDVSRFARAALELADRSDAPVCAYIYDLQALRAWARRLRAGLPPGCRLFYAIKANSEPAILRALATCVDGFEIASAGELEKAASAADLPIAFGGPGKTDAEIDRAIAAGVRWLHVESVHELHRIERLAERRRTCVPILLRVNLREALPAATLAMAGVPTQFGIDEFELPLVLQAAQNCAHVRLDGFHLHSLSNNLDADSHLEMIRLYLDRVAAWERSAGRAARVLNVGGGIGVDYARPHRAFDWARFCDGLGQMLRARGGEGAEIVFECGRFVTAACGAYAVEVLDLKRNHGATFAIVRGGTHQFRLPASWQHSHPFVVLPLERWPHTFARPEITGERVTVAGQLCTPKDVLARCAPVERLRIGDVLLFTYAGAYGWSISHHDFLSHPHPQVCYLDEDSAADRRVQP